MFIKSIQQQILQRFETAEKKWTEDDATPGTDGHENSCMAIKRLYNLKLQNLECMIRVDYGDNYVCIYEIKVNEIPRLLYIWAYCDGCQIREGMI